MWVLGPHGPGQSGYKQHGVKAKSKLIFGELEHVLFTALPHSSKTHETAWNMIDILSFQSS
jgi:hypothetical protein